MNTLLVVNSSPRSNSVSRRLTRHIAEAWQAKDTNGRIIERDLASSSLPFLTEEWIVATMTPADKRTVEQKETLALSDALIGELQAADLIVLGVPMHNFSIPGSLKAWIDLITRAGKTLLWRHWSERPAAVDEESAGGGHARRRLRRGIARGFPDSLLAAHAGLYRLDRRHDHRSRQAGVWRGCGTAIG